MSDMNKDSSAKLLVLTGGPGAGKTSLLTTLQCMGFPTQEEAGRTIIQDQQRIGGSALPWIDPNAFAEQMLGWDMRSYRHAQQESAPVFLDRGIPDIVGYLELCGLPAPAHLDKAARTFRYDQVFLLRPWPEIFVQDRERRQTPDEAARTCEAMERVYSRLGYQLTEVPRGSLEQRAAFVIDRMNGRG
ncbi:AAA family ATPase [Chromobacterium sp. IIBBL 290-4]|uniref:AAA family ATPase n=1 Tax=Chromobacterium sp. IIBBL 290-4 TaxID=2953890 RepID=UPI0020B8DA6D|nr:AAA family ATPase [Chromobacterium sp. IIBBL 290-4]UTH73595.1 AAA family ATPase [Chromobacterium sp. IIBBL 290-4]